MTTSRERFEKLAPCPFCGSALHVRSGVNPRAQCPTEGCFGRKMPVVNLDVLEDVVAWNTRALADAARPVETLSVPDGNWHPMYIQGWHARDRAAPASQAGDGDYLKFGDFCREFEMPNKKDRRLYKTERLLEDYRASQQKD